MASLYALLAVTGARGDDDLISADRPGIADGSQTVKRGQFQIEAGLQEEHDRSDGIDSRQLLTPSLFRYGVTDRFEARIESDAYQRLRIVGPDSRATSTGWAPVAIGFKVHFVDEALDQHRPSMGLIVRFVPPSGTSDFRSDRASGDVRFAADYELGKWSLNPNLGVAVGPDDENRNFVSALAFATLNLNAAWLHG
ncbi:MAG: transporter, partial [Acidobacteriota bacterium]